MSKKVIDWSTPPKADHEALGMPVRNIPQNLTPPPAAPKDNDTKKDK